MSQLTISGLSKAYSGVPAIRDVSMAVPDGHVVGLVGENGAGKSTILDIISGVTQPDAGEVLLDGVPVRPRSYGEATSLGIFRVFQEQALLPNLTVAENLFLTHEARFRQGGVVRRDRLNAHAAETLARLGLEIDVTRPASSFPFSTRQTIEILRCFAIAELDGVERPTILFDEPTAALARHELEAFFERLDALRGRLTAIFVSHRLREAIEHCDHLVVLKDGEITWETPPAGVDESALHQAMVGRIREADYYQEAKQTEAPGPVLLELDGLSCAPFFHDVSFGLRAGEVVGLGGMRGCGKAEVGEVLAGIRNAEDGRLRILEHDAPLRGSSASRIRDGIAYVPQERHRDGVMLDISVAWNLTLPALGRRFARGGVLKRRAERADVERTMRELRIKAPSPDAAIRSLSGGNQQKVVLGKWLLGEPRILVMDNPTRGVDAGAKHEMYTLIRTLTEQGIGVVLITDDLPELTGLSDRILIMKDGRVAETLEAPPARKPTEHALVQHMV